MTSMRRASSGFTIMEALISLVVVSLMLSLLLPIVGFGLIRNQSMGLGGLETMQTRLGEQLFRELVESAARKPIYRLSEEFESSLQGGATSARIRIEVSRRLPCALEGTISQIELFIVQKGEGGELHCKGPPGGTRLLAWTKGRGEFMYSMDGADWFTDWPVPERSGTSGIQPQDKTPPIALLRFSVLEVGAPGINWIVSVGTPEAPIYRFRYDRSGDGELPI